MDNFQLDNYLSKAFLSNHTFLTQDLSEQLSPKLLSDVIIARPI